MSMNGSMTVGHLEVTYRSEEDSPLMLIVVRCLRCGATIITHEIDTRTLQLGSDFGSALALSDAMKSREHVCKAAQ